MLLVWTNAVFQLELQAILLNGENESMDSMNLLRLMAPIAALMLVPAIALLEPGVLGVALKLLSTKPAFGMLLLANSSLAYIVNYTNFKLTKCTSALTLQVCLRHPTSPILMQQRSLAQCQVWLCDTGTLRYHHNLSYHCRSTCNVQVLGCAKGVLATFVSLFLFGNQISGLGAVGYGITVSGVLGYGLSKHRTSNT